MVPATGALRKATAALVAKPARTQLLRSFRSGAPSKSAGGHGHDHSSGGGGGAYSDDAYIHAEHMYDLPAMKNRKLKFGLGVSGAVAVGVGVPLLAFWHQLK